MSLRFYPLSMAAVLAPLPAAAAPSVTSDAVIDSLKAAIARSDREAFAGIDDSIEYLPEWKGRTIPSNQAVDLLSGCEFQSRKTNDWGMTDLQYRCATRRNKLYCTTGNLTVMIYDDRGKTEVGLSEDRVMTNGCPRMPAPPSVEAN